MVYVAEDKEKIIGCIIGVIHRDEPSVDIERYPSVNAKILELIVVPAFRDRRVGTALMQRIEEYFVSKDCDVITVECFAPNADAYKFYHKYGYCDRDHTLIKAIKSNSIPVP